MRAVGGLRTCSRALPQLRGADQYVDSSPIPGFFLRAPIFAQLDEHGMNSALTDAENRRDGPAA